jgi:hypothetical protein
MVFRYRGDEKSIICTSTDLSRTKGDSRLSYPNPFIPVVAGW